MGLTTILEKPLAGPVGVFGGTFDPVHLGHLLLAEQARELLNLNQVIWIPAATAPHPQIKQSTHQSHRLEMVRLATGGNPRFLVDDRELRRGGHSFTVDTLSELHQEFPAANWVLLIGSDSLAGFPKWRDPHRICSIAQVVVVTRGGQAPPDLNILAHYLPSPASLEELTTKHTLRIPQLEMSSSDIRERLSEGKSIRYMVPSSVEAFIQANELYSGRLKNDQV